MAAPDRSYYNDWDAPKLRLASPLEQTPTESLTTSLALHDLYQAGLLAKFYDEDGVERFAPMGGEL